MAKNKAYRWRGWRTDLAGGTIRDRTDRPGKGISNEQAKELGALCRAAGEPYMGNVGGFTAVDAAREIGRLKAKLNIEPNRDGR